MNFSRSMARIALRHGPCALRHFSSTRPVAMAAYHSYSFPTNNTTSSSSRNDKAPETTIAQAEPLPKVHETRPPPGQDAPLSAQQKQTSSSSSSSPSSSSLQNTAATASTTTPNKAPSEPTPTTSPTPKEAEAQKPAKATRPRSKLRARKAAMKLTPSAVEQLKALLDQPEPKLIKVGVRNRGCSGLAYHLEYVDKPGAFDETVEQDGVKVLIDSKALFSIIGSEMDWAEDKLNQRFVFKNPNIKEQCGCGESFMV